MLHLFRISVSSPVQDLRQGSGVSVEKEARVGRGGVTHAESLPASPTGCWRGRGGAGHGEDQSQPPAGAPRESAGHQGTGENVLFHVETDPAVSPGSSGSVWEREAFLRQRRHLPVGTLGTKAAFLGRVSGSRSWGLDSSPGPLPSHKMHLRSILLL